MPVVSVTIENPDELLNASMFGAGALYRVERSATGGGLGYAEIGTGVITAGSRYYTFYDLAGADTSWYRVRYSKSDASSPSSYGDEFQTGDETGGFLASVYDVEQRLGGGLSSGDKELVTELIREVTVAIEGFTGRWFVPRPLSGTATYRVATVPGRDLYVPKGIRSVTTLGLASTHQPDTGGTYTVTTGFYLDPPEMNRDAGWPATRIRFAPNATGRYYYATFGAEITGAFGWASVPADIEGVALRATMRRFLGKSGGALTVAVGPTGQDILLPDLSGADRATLDRYRDRGSLVAA